MDANMRHLRGTSSLDLPWGKLEAKYAVLMVPFVHWNKTRYIWDQAPRRGGVLGTILNPPENKITFFHARTIDSYMC